MSEGRSRNHSLWIGGALVLAALVLAIWGPFMAPNDPVKPNYIIFHPVTKEFFKPPFAPGVVPGLPLGVDTLGRDLWSRLLWAVRPTLTLVVLVATIRLVVGLISGLAAGWSSGQWGRSLQGLITVALTAPVLFVALCIIAALGINFGVWAFVLGLTITGWAETARLLASETQRIKHENYVDAARALGEGDFGIVIRHVLPQVMPLVWMLLALEVSTALMTTAGLGFLGYYINAVWVPLGDWSALRTSGRPELGQMLASGAAIALQQPWELLAAGGMVFWLVLGFTLTADGLRQHFELSQRRSTRLALMAEQVRSRLEARRPRFLSRGVPVYATVAALALLLIGGGVAIWQSQLRNTAAASSIIAIPGGHLWATARHDAQGTSQSALAGPLAPTNLWTYTTDARVSGGPALAADGTLYLAAGATLQAIDAAGKLRWQSTLPAAATGAPALAADGTVYVLGARAELWAIAPDGQLRWTVDSATGAPLAGPVVDAQGTVYFVTEDNLIAVAANGQVRWQVSIPTYSYVTPALRLNATEDQIYFEDTVSATADGRLLYEQTDDPLDKYVVGTNGQTYLVGQAGISAANFTSERMATTPYTQWDATSVGVSFRLPGGAGVTPDGRVWIFYGEDFQPPRIMWVEASGEIAAMLDFPWERGTLQLLGLDETNHMYVCGVNRTVARKQVGECWGYAAGRTAPIWKLALGDAKTPVGGAVAAGRIYVATAEGELIALADPNP